MNNEKDYVIYSQRLCAEIILAGIRLKKMKPDKNNPTKNVFFFADTEQVREIVKQYKLKSR